MVIMTGEEKGTTLIKDQEKPGEEETHEIETKTQQSDSPTQETDKASPSTSSETTEGNDGTSGGGSWWSGWYETAVKTSSQAYASVKKDLKELKEVVQTESRTVMSSSVVSSSLSAVASTASYIKDTANYLLEEEEEGDEVPDKEKETPSPEANDEDDEETRAKKLKEREASFEKDVKEMLKIPETLALKATEKITSVFNTIVDVLSPSYDDDDVVLLPDGETISKERWELLIRAVEADPRTFCHDPEGPLQEFASWLEKFDLKKHEDNVQRILETSTDVREFYDKLVPQELSRERFWQRYFYRVDKLKEMESRRAAALKLRQQQENDEKEQQIGDAASKAPSTLTTTNNASGPVNATSNDGSCHASPVNESSRGSSEEWEKTSMTEIVDEAAKKLAEKLQTLPMDGRSDEDMGEWELE